MDDLIKRQDAQMSVQDHYNKDHGFRSYEDGQRMLNRINALPSAQKTGKWITKSDTNPYYTTWWYECSECGQKPLQDGYGQEMLSDYCPHCGARMEREQE